jgi:5-dehydro-2-deoxygluconokinase
MTGYDKPLYMLAFDHRGSFEKGLLHVSGSPTDDERRRVREAKRVIYDAFALALGDGLDVPEAGLLVDEEYGAAIARAARVRGAALAMPVERSGQREFDFEFGDRFGEHIEAFDPTFVKVLVRYNPEGDAALNLRQAERLRRLSDWLHTRNRLFLFELLIPAEPHQLAAVDNDLSMYDLHIRPALVVETLAQLQGSGVEADIWKIEGLERRSDCERVVAQAHAGGREHVSCIVLGRGADEAGVARWLEQAAPVPGYIGFAVGRTLWWDPLTDLLEGRTDRATTVGRIADNYRHITTVYVEARKRSGKAAQACAGRATAGT